MSIAFTTTAPITAITPAPMRAKKTLAAIYAPIRGNIDGTNVYEIHDDMMNFARVRIEKGQDVEKLVKIIEDLKFLYVFGRHDISRIHQFIAKDTTGKSFKFSMSYSQVYKVALLANFHHVYTNLERHCSKPVCMARNFPKKGVLAFDGRREWEPDEGEVDYLEVIGSDAMDYNWDV